MSFSSSDTAQVNRAPEWLAPNVLAQPAPNPLPPGRWSWWDSSKLNYTTEVSFSQATNYATQIAPATTRLPFFWNYWDASKNQALENYQLPTVFIGSVPQAFTPAIYLLLIDHYLSTGLTKAGTIVTEGNQIPIGWKPTPAVDPQNTQAILNFWNAGPYFMNDGEESRDFYPFILFAKPVIRWVPVSGVPGFYQLTGAGASLGAKNA